MRSRVIFGMLLALLLISGTGIVTAQSGCGAFNELSPEDCTIIEDSDAAMADLSSTTFTLEMALTLENGLDMDEQVAFTTISNGAYAIAPLPNSVRIDEVIRSLNADVSVLIDLSNLSEELGVNLLESGDVLSADLALVDGVGYINFSKFTDDAEAQGWFGLDLVGMLGVILQSQGLDLSLLDLFGGGGTDVLGGLEFVPFTVARMDDTTREDTSLARFRWSADFGSALDNFFASMLWESVVNGFIIGALGDAANNYTDDELAEITQDYLLLLDDMTFTVDRLIDPTTGYVHETTLAFVFSPSSRTLTEIDAGLDPLNVADLFITIRFDSTLTRANFNAVGEIIAPADAQLIPPQELLPFVGDENM